MIMIKKRKIEVIEDSRLLKISDFKNIKDGTYCTPNKYLPCLFPIYSPCPTNLQCSPDMYA